MKKQILTLVLIALATCSFSQTNENIIVSYSGSDVAYADLENAIAGAADGATIYVPGGIHQFNSEVIIDKQLHFKGDGHYANTLAGSVPQIIGQDLSIKRGAHNSSFEGIYFSGNYVNLKHEAADTTGDFHVLFRRCKFDYPIRSSGGATWGLPGVSNIAVYLIESVVHGILFDRCVDAVYIDNCILTNDYLEEIDQGYVKNSILLDGLAFRDTENINVSNSISHGSFTTYYATNINISNCLLKTGASIDPSFTSSNILHDDWDNIFVNAPDNIFSIGNDYHLKSGCQGIGTGTGGTDMGIYGGANPWKEHSIPATPNVYYKAVSNQSDSLGNIDATYKVKAQDN